MNKDFVQRILNIFEILGYIFVLGYLGKYCKGCHYYMEDILLFLFFVAFLRICSNYLFQFKLFNIFIFFLIKKICTKLCYVFKCINSKWYN